MLYPTWTGLLSLPLTLNRHEAPAFNNSSEQHICPQKKSTCWIGIYGTLCFILTWKTKGLTWQFSQFLHFRSKDCLCTRCICRFVGYILKFSQKQSHCSPSPQIGTPSTLVQHIMPGLSSASTEPFKKSPGKPLTTGTMHAFFNSW